MTEDRSEASGRMLGAACVESGSRGCGVARGIAGVADGAARGAAGDAAGSPGMAEGAGATGELAGAEEKEGGADVTASRVAACAGFRFTSDDGGGRWDPKEPTAPGAKRARAPGGREEGTRGAGFLDLRPENFFA